MLLHKRLHKIVVAAALLCALLFWRLQSRHPSRVKSDQLEACSLPAYVGTGRSSARQCNDIAVQGRILLQPSFTVDDDLQAIALSLDGHPMIDYSNQDPRLTREELVRKTWLRLAHSSVWLDKLQVYLTVTRVIFYDRGVPHWGRISFLRGQIHDRHWTELQGYTIRWNGKDVTFPRVFDIDIPFEKPGSWYGPEDPRIIIDEDRDALKVSLLQEPVIVFNMVAKVTPEKPEPRAMFIYRPFSNDLKQLSVVGAKLNNHEKNWMPFFYHANMDADAQLTSDSQYIHFVYTFWPLQVLKCELRSGDCRVVYNQAKVDTPVVPLSDIAIGDPDTIFRGGTNFVPIDLGTTVQHFVGFPRTRVNTVCKDGFYRPELMVLAATPTEFYIEMISEPIEMGSNASAGISPEDICGDGRIVIANSIARWQHTSNQDLMTVSFSVDDRSTEVLLLQGVGRYIKGMIASSVRDDGEDRLSWSQGAQQVLGCAVQAARNYTPETVSSSTPGIDS